MLCSKRSSQWLFSKHVPLAPQSQRQCGLQNSSIPHLVTVRRSLIGVSIVQGKLNIYSATAASTVTENATGSLRIALSKAAGIAFCSVFCNLCLCFPPLSHLLFAVLHSLTLVCGAHKQELNTLKLELTKAHSRFNKINISNCLSISR